VIHSRVKNVDINMSLEVFARILHLSCEGVNIFHVALDDFEYPDGETALIASRLLRDDEEVKYYTHRSNFSQDCLLQSSSKIG